MDLKGIMFCERRLSQMVAYYMLAFLYMTFSKDKAIVMENRSVGASSYGSGNSVTING